MSYPFDPRFLALPAQRDAAALPLPPQMAKITDLLRAIWPMRNHAQIASGFVELWREAAARLPAEFNAQPANQWSERQFVFICYGDHLRSKNPAISPLQALAEFFREQFHEEIFSDLTVHLLPIYASPYKDGGFDIADPLAVNPTMGTWEDVRALRQQCHLALDFVANHLSIASTWFTRYVHDDPEYHDFFIGFDSKEEVARFNRDALPHIYRPRPHHPLIPVRKPDGSTRWVYMTFSEHQPDVNYANPLVCLKMAEILLFYVLQGANMIRLDAIPYLWKEWGTSCAHLPNTHRIVECFRLLVEMVNPSVKLLAESMEPLADSQRYLSTADHPQAHIAYNFAPCGLIPHTLLTGEAEAFQRQLAQFAPPDAQVNWAVVCGVTHDGSSLNPCRAPHSVEGAAVLSEAQIERVAAYYTARGMRELQQRSERSPDDSSYLPPDFLAQFTRKHGAEPRFVNFKTIVDEQGNARQIVYEAISTYSSLFDQQPEKILAALTMALALPGIPFIYFTAPFALRNDFRYYLDTGNPRELNRGRVCFEELQQDLRQAETLTATVFQAYLHFLRLRVSLPAFHPHGAILPLMPGSPASLLAFLRISPDRSSIALVAQNISSEAVDAELVLPETPHFSSCQDLLTEERFDAVARRIRLPMSAFQIRWCACRFKS